MLLDMSALFLEDTPPMPLKHTTETLLVFILGTAMVVTGIVIPSLTKLDAGIAPWAIVFAIAVVYPLALAGLFKRNRADYSFRLLHWVPAILLFILLLMQSAVYLLPLVQPMVDWYTWGWALPGVATGFFLLTYFCISVIRRWTKRIVLLTVLFVPFMVGAVASEHYDWNKEIAATLWEGEWWKWEGEEGSLVAKLDTSEDVSSEKNLDASVDPSEESYRERLRAIETRRERIASRLEQRRLIEDMEEGEEEDQEVAATTESVSSASVEIREVSSMPSTLPSSGLGWAAIILTMLGLYTASVHTRTCKRAEALV